MRNVFFTSDTHFCHDRGFIYEPRGFDTIKKHDEMIVENWNKVVKPQDIVYHLGDTLLNDNAQGLEYFKKLNGFIILIRGNHDTDVRLKMLDFFCLSINVACIEKINGYQFYLSHYPTITSSVENMAPLKHHLINLHGHTHSKNKFYQDMPFIYNVALDAHNHTPVSFDEVITDIEKKKDECLAML